MRGMVRFAVLTAMCIAWSTTALAQSPVAPGEWNRCTTLTAFVAASGDTTQVGTALGGAIGWDITPAIGIEGAGAWAEFGQDTTAFSGTLKVRARVGGTRTIDPFFLAGIGMYHTSFGENDTAILIRARDGQYYAYGQKCTHLTCPVYYSKNNDRLECPCHEGGFDVRDGRVLYGPPPRPLDRVEIELRGSDVWATGLLHGGSDEHV